MNKKKIGVLLVFLTLFIPATVSADSNCPSDFQNSAEDHQTKDEEVLSQTVSLRKKLEALLKTKKEALNKPNETVADSQKNVASIIRPQLQKQLVPIFEDATLDTPEDSDVLYFTYGSGSISSFSSAPGYITDIRLAPGEIIQRITVGDKLRWQLETFYDLAKTRWHIYIKPIQLNIDTNMIINTDKHSYQLQATAMQPFNPIVEWKYPNEQKEVLPTNLPLEVDSVDKLNFNYRVSRAQEYSWTPKFVFDDGFRTFIQLPENALAKTNPALFIVNENGSLLLEQYAISQNSMVVRTVSKYLQLRVGDEMVKIRKF